MYCISKADNLLESTLVKMAATVDQCYKFFKVMFKNAEFAAKYVEFPSIHRFLIICIWFISLCLLALVTF